MELAHVKLFLGFIYSVIIFICIGSSQSSLGMDYPRKIYRNEDHVIVYEGNGMERLVAIKWNF